MEVVINESISGRHTIDKYKFKVFSSGSSSDDEHTKSFAEQQLEEQPVAQRVEEAPASESKPQPSPSHRDELVESLLKKTDDVTSNFIKMQMKIEEMEQQHKAALEAARQEAYESGVQDGRNALQKEVDDANENGLQQFAESVKKLETTAEHYMQAVGKIESELTLAAIDIAKEVIAIEVSEQGSEIAKKLASSLIKELQGAAKVTLKVNPADHGEISQHVGTLSHVNVVSDKAISRGGVIAISDAGNIDSEVMKRFERIKQAALSE